MNHSNIVQRSEEWQNVRLGRFTASTIHKIICSNPAKLTETAKTHILEKVTETIYEKPSFSPDTASTRWGEEHESMALVEYQQKNKILCSSVGFVAYGDHAGCSPDKLVGEHGGVECKCPYNSINHIKHCTIRETKDLLKINKAYYWQVMMALLCTGREWWDFVSFDPRLPKDHKLRLFQFRVFRDQKAIDRLINCLAAVVLEKKQILNRLNKNKTPATV